MTFPQLLDSQANKETRINEANLALITAGLFGKDPTSSGLSYKVLGGNDIFVSLYDVLWNTAVPADTTLTLSATATHYIVAKRSDSTISLSTSNTNWNDTANYARIRIVTTVSSVITSDQDYRTSSFGTHAPAAGASLTNPMTTQGDIIYGSTAGAAARLGVGLTGEILTSDGTNPVWAPPRILQNSQSAAYTAVLADSGKHILHPSADTTARVFTIPANSSVAFPIGTALTFVNQNAAGVITISITTDTMRLAGTGSTGSRSLAANGIATALKITSTEWIISGTGLT